MGNITTLENITGMSIEELAEESMSGIAEGICTNKNCDYTATVESDCYDGYCEECKTQTVQSACAMLGII